MKRLLAMLCVIACLAALCVPAMAAYGDNMIPILAKVPDGWDTAYLYTWKGDGQWSEAWPGAQMTQLEDGWYYVYVPNDMEKAIVNNGNGTQTADLEIQPGVPVWITVASDNSAEVSYSPLNDANVPAYTVELYTVHIFFPYEWDKAYIWAWNDAQTNVFDAWPGEKLSRDADGFCTIELPTWATNLLVTAGPDGPQTIDLAVSAAEQWIVVGALEGEKHAISTHASAPEVPAEPTEPETQPTEPETQPTEPETQPTEPETQPTEPETQPTEPETQATAPTTMETEVTEPVEATQPGTSEQPKVSNPVPMIVGIVVAVAAVIATAAVLLTKKKEN